MYGCGNNGVESNIDPKAFVPIQNTNVYDPSSHTLRLYLTYTLVAILRAELYNLKTCTENKIVASYPSF